MQDLGKSFVFIVVCRKQGRLSKNAVSPIPVENLGKGETKMRSIFNGILGILDVAGASAKGKGWTAWAFDLASAILG